ncbi:helicase, partial [Listeria monocytogenes]
MRRTTENKNHVLFLVHRKELIDQIQNTLEVSGVDMKHVTLGMVQTIVRRLD